MTTESRIEKLLERKNITLPSMVARWINGGLVSPQGRFIVQSISNMRVSGRSTGNMRFTATVRLSLAPDFRSEITKRYVWVKNGSGFRGEFI